METYSTFQRIKRERKSQSADGSDPVEQKFFKDYSKKRNGLKHQNDKPSNSKGSIEV